MVTCLSDARLDDRALVAQALLGTPERSVELSKRATADIAQLTAFQVVPDTFDWIEIGGVARQLLEMDPLGSPAGQGAVAPQTAHPPCRHHTSGLLCLALHTNISKIPLTQPSKLTDTNSIEFAMLVGIATVLGLLV